MTDKLYWHDPHATTFDATLLRVDVHRDRRTLVLDKTLFYPEGGGQLGDAGILRWNDRELTIVDTQIGDDGTIHHVVDPSPANLEGDAPLPPNASGGVRGTIAAPRRRDHMAQHTAQHALSRALLDEAKAATVSARLGAKTCTIDVSRASIPDGELHRVEDVVNALVTSDVAVRALFPTREELAALPLRKQPSVAEGIRVIDIDGFDMSPCGGTHCTRTGQIGQVRITGLEKYKGGLRVTFHAGLRALHDARTTHGALASIASSLTCGFADVPAAIDKLRGELKATRTQLDATRAELVDFVAARALASVAADAPAPVVLSLVRPNDDVGALRVLAGKLASDPRVVAICAAPDPITGEIALVVQRGTSASIDCGAFVMQQAKARGGRGGGRPERAEGRFPRGTSVDDLVAALGAT